VFKAALKGDWRCVCSRTRIGVSSQVRGRSRIGVDRLSRAALKEELTAEPAAALEEESTPAFEAAFRSALGSESGMAFGLRPLQNSVL